MSRIKRERESEASFFLKLQWLGSFADNREKRFYGVEKVEKEEGRRARGEAEESG